MILILYLSYLIREYYDYINSYVYFNSTVIEIIFIKILVGIIIITIITNKYRIKYTIKFFYIFICIDIYRNFKKLLPKIFK